jgi:HAD superfamily hydrolase (TIGR01490 family)
MSAGQAAAGARLAGAHRPTLVLFDLDHTLLDGDTDVLWCEFLMREGLLDRARFEPRNADMERRYRAGDVSAEAFCGFYVSTLAGRSLAQWQPVLDRFVAREVVPRLKPAGLACLRRHLQRRDEVVLTTATNRVLTEPTARHLGIEHLIATEVEGATEPASGDGLQPLPGRTTGVLNMRAGKVTRLQRWLADRQEHADRHGRLASPETLRDAWFFSDSINDLPLLEAVGQPLVVDPDPTLRQAAAARGWPVLHWIG